MIRIMRDGEEYEVTPLHTRRVQLGTAVIFDAAAGGRSWFYLDLLLSGPKLFTATGAEFNTAEGKTILTCGRHRLVAK